MDAERVARARRNMHLLFAPMYPKGSPLPDELDAFAFETMYWYTGIDKKLYLPQVKSRFLNRTTGALLNLCEAYCYVPPDKPRMRITTMEQIKTMIVLLEEYVVACGVSLE